LIETIRVNLGESVLELCAGSGAISLSLAEKAKRIVAVDINQYAVSNINTNIKKEKINKN